MNSWPHKDRKTLPNKPQQTALCSHSLPLIWRSRDEICLLFPLFSFALFYFSLQHLLACLSPLLLSRCIKWGDYSGSVGLHLKVQSVKRAFLCLPLIFYPFPLPHLLYPTFFLSLYPSPSALLLLMRSLAFLNLKQGIEPLICLNLSTPLCLSPSAHLAFSLLSI